MLRVIIRGFIYRFSFQVIMFIITVLIAELMGTSQFGDLSMMIVNAAAFMLITGLGTDAAIVWHASGKSMSVPKTFSFAILCGALQFLIYMAAQYISRSYFDQSLLARAPEGFLAYETIYIIGLILTEKYTSLLYGHQMANSANRILSFVAAFFLLSVILIYADVLPPVEPTLVYTMIILLLGVVLAITFHAKIDARIGGLNRSDIEMLMTFSGVVFITNLIQFFAYRLDFWLIDHYHGSSEVGIYAQANRFAQLLWIIPGIFAGLIVPSIRKQQDGLSESEFNRLTRSINIVNLAVAISVLIFAWMIYNFFMSSDFSQGWQPLLMMLPGYLFFALTTILAAWFSAKKLLVVNLIGSVLCFIIIAALDLILIPTYSMKGAAIANSIAYSLTTFYFIYQYMVRSRIRFNDLFLFRMKDISGLKNLFVDGR